MTAFQSNAFQQNALQIGGSAATSFDCTITLTQDDDTISCRLQLDQAQIGAGWLPSTGKERRKKRTEEPLQTIDVGLEAAAVVAAPRKRITLADLTGRLSVPKPDLTEEIRLRKKRQREEEETLLLM